MPELLEPRIRAAKAILETEFIFRKLGLCYDFASDPEDFPRKTLPNPREIRAAQPSLSGRGAGLAECAWNSALLFDGYLLRIELGIGRQDEEKILDRLIGGLIRLATTAPKGHLVRGLTPDGRGFYPATDMDAYVLWAFAVWRALRSPAISPESQLKFRNIVSRWMGRLEKDGFRLTLAEGNAPHPAPGLDALDGIAGPKLLALLAVASEFAEDKEKWAACFLQKIQEQEGARLSASSPLQDPTALLSLSIAWHLLQQIDKDETRKELARTRLRGLAAEAEAFLNRADALDPERFVPDPLDWRKTPDPDPKHWPRLSLEQDSIGAVLQASLCIFLAGEKEQAMAAADRIASCLCLAPWDRLLYASSFSAVLAVHARGIELGLWDQDLPASSPIVGNIESFVARYLTDDFDDRNPLLAGHRDPPPNKKKPMPEEPQAGERKAPSRARRKRRRR